MLSGLVHRRDEGQVLVTGVERRGGGRFRVPARWPGGHRFCGPSADGGSDPQLVCETMRQAGILVGHVGYGIPQDHSFVMNELSHAVDWGELTPTDSGTRLTVDVECRDVLRRGRTVLGIKGTMLLHRDDRQVGSGTFAYRCISPAVYERLRGRARSSQDPALSALPAALDAYAVGRVRGRDVVLAAGGLPGTFLLRADRDHPVLYDHPLDHVPGMAVIEGMRQAARFASGLRGAQNPRIEAEFAHYVEHDAPCFITTGAVRERSGGLLDVPVHVRQREQEVARGLISLRPLPGVPVRRPCPTAAEHRAPVRRRHASVVLGRH
ncbi:ScbA/BarX family gamma-butyrolactone biosynthesis protein [Streptomyces sp. TP-A0356]|uniref:ScbA/BarX family gamma-butyrolactone biosynthesis protein n=1 Tax=Streptomyces sp. TP-A0356 TaxID=1359208 RepID=UPI0006E469D7|nr:ScbA/BarX family gamma-butyrolactone biosynthesis protein [Streptomyces sp. TP-A0356]